jgi:hypothetical protein
MKGVIVKFEGAYWVSGNILDLTKQRKIIFIGVVVFITHMNIRHIGRTYVVAGQKVNNNNYGQNFVQ